MQQPSSFQVISAAAGSGKTFSLVKDYLKILLKSKNRNKFQQILAVTFTNKAAGEMKDRVIQMLNSFSRAEENDMLQMICSETGLEKEEIFKRSTLILEAIFRRYGAFNIVTIDSFTHHLIRTFAYDLQLPLNFEVELDAESLLNEAVDLVISKIGEDKKLTSQLVDFAYQKLDADKSWDISGDLKKFSNLILNENNSAKFRKLYDVNPEMFTKLSTRLRKENTKLIGELETLGNNGLTIIKTSGLNANDFYRSMLPKHFQLLSNDYKKAAFFDQSTLKERIEEGTFYAKSKPDNVKRTIDGLLPQLLDYYNQSESLYRKITRNELIINSLNPLAVLSHISRALETIKIENNVLLNAEFNEMIAETIKHEPAPFIYERIGDRFRYYFIDEMQDTSVRQWQNLIPLIENALTSENEFGERGELVMVGDSKQAIYRWRGGKAEQFIALASEDDTSDANPFFVPKSVINLKTNYRSHAQIIDFNNTFFKYVSRGLSNTAYRNLYLESSQQLTTAKEGGFVQLSFLEKHPETNFADTQIPKKICEIIHELDTEFQRNEICVLVRTRKQGIAVANYLAEKGIAIISSETLLIANNERVKFIVDLLQVMFWPGDEETKMRMLHFLHRHLQLAESKHVFAKNLIHKEGQQFFEGLSTYGILFETGKAIQKPLYDRIEYIIRAFRLSESPDAGLQFFLDVVYEFQIKHQSDLQAFLDYWEHKKEHLSIVAPEISDAVRIMTIHKAKGLEFPVVIFPYDMDIYKQIDPVIWYNLKEEKTIKNALIAFKKELKYIDSQGAERYQQRREALELDTLNLLYVTLTRAQEQLYVVTEKTSPNSRDGFKKTSSYFINYLIESGDWVEDKTDYSFGKRNRISEKKKKKNDGTYVKQQRLISTAWSEKQIAVLNESNVLWGTEQGEAIAYGNLLHELLARIVTKSDIEETVAQFVYKGLISQADKKPIEAQLKELVAHPRLKKCFDHNFKVLCEQEILTSEGNIVIPDRLVIENRTVNIVEYKTGKKEEKHKKQVDNYSHVLKNMGYEIGDKLLVYLNKKITVEEV